MVLALPHHSNVQISSVLIKTPQIQKCSKCAPRATRSAHASSIHMFFLCSKGKDRVRALDYVLNHQTKEEDHSCRRPRQVLFDGKTLRTNRCAQGMVTSNKVFNIEKYEHALTWIDHFIGNVNIAHPYSNDWDLGFDLLEVQPSPVVMGSCSPNVNERPTAPSVRQPFRHRLCPPRCDLPKT